MFDICGSGVAEGIVPCAVLPMRISATELDASVVTVG